jgi:hypothetical protein
VWRVVVKTKSRNEINLNYRNSYICLVRRGSKARTPPKRMHYVTHVYTVARDYRLIFASWL